MCFKRISSSWRSAVGAYGAYPRTPLSTSTGHCIFPRATIGTCARRKAGSSRSERPRMPTSSSTSCPGRVVPSTESLRSVADRKASLETSGKVALDSVRLVPRPRRVVGIVAVDDDVRVLPDRLDQGDVEQLVLRGTATSALSHPRVALAFHA